MKRLTSPLALLVALGIALFPLVHGGFAMGHDWSLELVRVAEYRFAFSGGQHPPFWAPDFYGGRGSPIFLFYAPLFLAVSSALVTFTHNVISAATAALILFTIIGVLLMWLLCRRICPGHPMAARIGAIVYALSPYLLEDKWIRNANAEFAALSLLPGVLIGATEKKPWAAFWWTALPLAGVILAHNITALVAAALAIAIPIFVHRNLRALLPVGLGIAAALALTAFFWLPALTMMPLIHPQDLLIGKFDFHYQFPELLAFFWPVEDFSCGWLAVLLLPAAFLLTPKDLYSKRIEQCFGLAAIVLILLMLPLSTRVWEIVPMLRYVQFPWRFFGPLTILLAAAGAIASTRIPQLESHWWVEWSVLAVVLLNAYPAIRDYQPMPAFVRQQGEEALTPEGIRKRKLTTTVYDEYLPATGHLYDVPAAPGTQLLHKWSFPVWSASIDGKPVPIKTSEGGLVAVGVPAGDGEVVLTLEEPAARRLCNRISLAAVLLLAGIAIVGSKKFRAS